MAYMSQERKASIQPVVKAILAKHNIKGALGVKHYSTLVLNIRSGPVNFLGDYKATSQERERGHIQVNVYHVASHFTGLSATVLAELVAAMNVGNHDRSDIQVDHHDVGWYVNVNIGQYDRPYEFTGVAAPATAGDA